MNNKRIIFKGFKKHPLLFIFGIFFFYIPKKNK